jgi:hypothetical protein
VDGSDNCVIRADLCHSAAETGKPPTNGLIGDYCVCRPCLEPVFVLLVMCVCVCDMCCVGVPGVVEARRPAAGRSLRPGTVSLLGAQLCRGPSVQICSRPHRQ